LSTSTFNGLIKVEWIQFQYLLSIASEVDYYQRSSTTFATNFRSWIIKDYKIYPWFQMQISSGGPNSARLSGNIGEEYVAAA